VLLGLFEQIRFAVNENVITFEQHVTRGRRTTKSNRAILWVDISRGFVRGSIHIDFSSIASLEKQKYTTSINTHSTDYSNVSFHNRASDAEAGFIPLKEAKAEKY
jgi:hypothetical protein